MVFIACATVYWSHPCWHYFPPRRNPGGGGSEGALAPPILGNMYTKYAEFILDTPFVTCIAEGLKQRMYKVQVTHLILLNANFKTKVTIYVHIINRHKEHYIAVKYEVDQTHIKVLGACGCHTYSALHQNGG